MIRILLGLLLLEVCSGTEQTADGEKHLNYWKSFGGPSNNQLTRRIIRDSAHQKTFGKYGNYLTTVIFVDLPNFSDIIDMGDVTDHTDKFNIQYKNVKFSNLSSAYAISYRIDLDASQVQLILCLGKVQIKGAYSVSTPSTPNTAGQDFELNLYANLLYTYNILFQVDENGNATFGKTENHRFQFDKVKGKYTNPPIALATELENYLNPKLLEAIVTKIYDEVHQKISLDDVGFQIKNEIAFRYRNHIADRFKKAVRDAFADVHGNAFSVFFHDKFNFNEVIQNLNVTIPTFVMRGVENVEITDIKISFAGDDVHANVKYSIFTPLIIFTAVYHNINDTRAQNKIVKAEYHILYLTYEFKLIAKAETSTVELEYLHVETIGMEVAPTQGLYGDERDIIIQQLTKYIESYFHDNAHNAFLLYLKGICIEGRIAHQVFK